MTVPDEQAWATHHFETMLQCASAEARDMYAVRHPVLLSASALASLLATSGDAERQQALQRLDALRQFFWDHPDRYPLGEGPLEPIIEALRKGETSYDAAHQAALHLDRAGLLSNTYLHVLFECWTAWLDSTLTLAVQAATIALDAAWAMPFLGLAPDVRLGAAKGFIHLAHGALMQRPDGGLLERAEGAGAWALAEADRRSRPELRGQILVMLGTMLLDAYASRWPLSHDYPAIMDRWLSRAARAMPTPRDGLGRAVHHLKQAVDLHPSEQRGTTFKALVQAEAYEACSRGAQPDLEELRRRIRQAFEHLDRGADAEAWQYVEAIAKAYGVQ